MTTSVLTFSVRGGESICCNVKTATGPFILFACNRERIKGEANNYFPIVVKCNEREKDSKRML